MIASIPGISHTERADRGTALAAKVAISTGRKLREGRADVAVDLKKNNDSGERTRELCNWTKITTKCFELSCTCHPEFIDSLSFITSCQDLPNGTK
jgi:hypothetical protein